MGLKPMGRTGWKPVSRGTGSRRIYQSRSNEVILLYLRFLLLKIINSLTSFAPFCSKLETLLYVRNAGPGFLEGAFGGFVPGVQLQGLFEGLDGGLFFAEGQQGKAQLG